jgi:Protein of unknown function (DUF2281)
MSNLLTYNKIQLLPDHLKVEVNDFVDFLLTKEEKKKTALKKGDSIMNFSGILTEEEAEELQKSINECRQIDYNEW